LLGPLPLEAAPAFCRDAAWCDDVRPLWQAREVGTWWGRSRGGAGTAAARLAAIPLAVVLLAAQVLAGTVTLAGAAALGSPAVSAGVAAPADVAAPAGAAVRREVRPGVRIGPRVVRAVGTLALAVALLALAVALLALAA
jgi:hypothetical protein